MCNTQWIFKMHGATIKIPFHKGLDMSSPRHHSHGILTHVIIYCGIFWKIVYTIEEMQQKYPQHLSVSVKNFWLQTGEISDVGCRRRWTPKVRIMKIRFSACLSHKSNYSAPFSVWIFSPQLRNFVPIKLKLLIRKTLRIYRHREIWQWANELQLHAIWKNAEHEGAVKAHM